MPAQSNNLIEQSGREVCRAMDYLITSGMIQPKHVQLALGTDTCAFVTRWRADRVMSAAHFRVLCRSRQIKADARRFLQSLVFDDWEVESLAVALERGKHLRQLARAAACIRPWGTEAADAGEADNADRQLISAALDQWMQIALLAQHMAGYLRRVAVRNGIGSMRTAQREAGG